MYGCPAECWSNVDVNVKLVELGIVPLTTSATTISASSDPVARASTLQSPVASTDHRTTSPAATPTPDTA